MKKRFYDFVSGRYMPRWLVLVFDLSVALITFYMAYLLRFNLDIIAADNAINLDVWLLITPVFLCSFLIIRPFAGILRHSTTSDVVKIIIAISAGSMFIFTASFLSRSFTLPLVFNIPLSVVIIHYALANLVLVASRLIIKTVFLDYMMERQRHKDLHQVMIYGAGQLGQIARDVMLADSMTQINLVGFIDDNTFLQGKRLGDIPVYSPEKAFGKIIDQYKVNEIILAISKDKISMKRKRAFIDLCLQHSLVIKEIPPVHSWINGELNLKMIRKVRIDDLLERDAIKLDVNNIREGLQESTILVTGGAGSIGSEIVRQLLAFHAKRVILLDQAETPLYDIRNEILSNHPDAQVDLVIADVSNQNRLRSVFEKFRPDIVFNAAAYKHVPMMEDHPYEAININVRGTKYLADLAVEFGVKKFVMISTDKAVNPTNVMGASKRICEMYIQSLVHQNGIKTQFITTRFGNVLGSNGSVVPMFKKQIEEGGPITVTHPKITRYFMTIPEACQLVLEAGFMGKGGEIYLFDMGEPVVIYEMAKKMIRLSGLTYKKDIDIVFTGLRPGEKLYEELLATAEDTLPTHNEKIMISNVVVHEYDKVNAQITAMLEALDQETDEALVSRMKEIVPEYVSENSRFCSLDGKGLELGVSGGAPKF